MENIVQKITQPIFVSGNFVNQNENEKWDEKLIHEEIMKVKEKPE